MGNRHWVAALATGAVAAGAALSAIGPAAAAAGCRVTYTVTSQWTGGFGASVSLTNLGDAVSTWRLGWAFGAGQTVQQLWNGTVTQTGAQVSVANAAWNGSLASGATVSFGFNGSWTGSNPVPTAYTLNGTACNGPVPPGSPSASASSSKPASPSASPSSSKPASPSPSASTPPAGLAQVYTPGRVRTVDGVMQYTWPGVYFEGRFRGTGVGVALNDSNNDYVVQVDGATVATLVTPGRTTYWVNNLSNAEHTVRLAKRTESPWAAGEFSGFVAAPGGAILSRPAARPRQVELIGDSWTAGYGNMSTTRDCSSNGGVTRNSNADSAFGALAAKDLGADYQTIAWSGLGMVRNYGGQNTATSFRSYYDTDLQALYNSAVWPNPGTWKPQVVVVGLGINDFSTALTAGEPWATVDALAADYRTAYLAFIAKLRDRYGPDTYIVLTYPDLSYITTAFASSVQQIVQTRAGQGDTRVRSLYYDDNALGLDHLGCDWHPSLHDDRIIAGALTTFINGLPLTW
ncbi:cellulose binding domain-containing protein [Dactylosporangium sp. McL0621]|uniref:cellulose binding domain-containing protein n=1 Tax=Dactylosporangium sp. McL0621 TaxID=3415678 RepID=UPI003CEFAF11